MDVTLVRKLEIIIESFSILLIRKTIILSTFALSMGLPCLSDCSEVIISNGSNEVFFKHMELPPISHRITSYLTAVS